ncbi:DUF6302 family protein [Streptomyces sp. C36]|uniref:DUF6302 family protein n=1 Tax=Streptomyces sp. C36 TaxID=3237122 RepID=UPI0034C5EB08
MPPHYPPLPVAVLPPQSANDYEAYRNRLVDLSVLELSLAIHVFRVPLLAVAAGGPRRGGALVRSAC